MRRLLALVAMMSLLSLPLLSVPFVHAQDPLDLTCDTNGDGAVDPDLEDSPACSQDGSNPIAGDDGILTTVVEILSWVAGVAAVIMVLLGGLKYITANGDSNAISSAKNTILYALIGIAVFAVSQAIVIFVIRKL